VDETPLPFLAHRVGISLAQEAYAVGFEKLFDVGGKALELPMKGVNSPRILRPPKDEFLLALALALLIHTRERHGQGYQQQRGHQHDRQQRITALCTARCDAAYRAAGSPSSL
jgi:hypothetical protein